MNFDQDLHRYPILWQMKIQLKLMLPFFSPLHIIIIFIHSAYVFTVRVMIRQHISGYISNSSSSNNNDNNDDNKRKYFKRGIFFHQKPIRLETIAFDWSTVRIFCVCFQMFTRINLLLANDKATMSMQGKAHSMGRIYPHLQRWKFSIFEIKNFRRKLKRIFFFARDKHMAAEKIDSVVKRKTFFWITMRTRNEWN